MNGNMYNFAVIIMAVVGIAAPYARAFAGTMKTEFGFLCVCVFMIVVATVWDTGKHMFQYIFLHPNCGSAKFGPIDCDHGANMNYATLLLVLYCTYLVYLTHLCQDIITVFMSTRLIRDHSGHDLSEWEVTFPCNFVPHWTSPYT